MAERPMSAGTIAQPHAWAIVHGFQRVVNSSWSPRRDLIGGWLLIHASEAVDLDAYDEARDLVRLGGGGLPDPGDLALGALIGAVRVTGAYGLNPWRPTAAGFSGGHAQSPGGPWASGPICWTLADAVVFATPVGCHGEQGIWEAPEGLRVAVRQQWHAAQPERSPPPAANERGSRRKRKRTI